MIMHMETRACPQGNRMKKTIFLIKDIVIPAKAGTQASQQRKFFEILGPRFRGDDGYIKIWKDLNLLTGIFTLFLCSVMAITPAVAQDGDAPVTPDGQPTYTVKDGQVDRGTYNGYRRFHSVCHTCHGFDANGSSFAPSLAESMKRLSYDQFKEVVINGRQNQGATGDKVMPSFGANPDVVQNLDDIYRYLKARSDDALPGGRPQRIGS